MKYISFILLFFYSSCLWAQADTAYYDMFLNEVKTKDKAYYFAMEGFKKDTSDTYTFNMYYMDGKIRMSTECVINGKDTLPPRQLTTYFENGNKEEVFDFSNGIKNYYYERYYANGKKMYEGNHLNGQSEGYAAVYYPSGCKRREINFEKGKLEGLCLEYRDSSDLVWIKCNYKGGKLNGDETVYYKNGRIRSVKFFKNGVYSSYYCFDKEGNKLSWNSAHVIPESNCDFDNYIESNMDYPRECWKKNIGGTVWVIAYIDENGKVYDAVANKRENPLLDAEAIRLVKNAPKFVPAQDEEGKLIKARLFLNIHFKRGREVSFEDIVFDGRSHF